MKQKLINLKSLLCILMMMVGINTSWAKEATITFASGTNGNDIYYFQSTSGSITDVLSFSSAKNSSTANPAYNSSNSDLRLYYHSGGVGGSVTLTAESGVTITGFVLTTSTTPTTKYTAGTGTATTVSYSDNVATVSGLSCTKLKIQNCNTSNTQLRIKSIKVIYSGANEATPLAAPTNLSASNITSNSAQLSWNAVTNASSYTLKVGDTEYPNVTSPYTATSLESDTKYTWTVKAIGDGSNYASSSYATNATFTTELPEDISIFTMSAADGADIKFISGSTSSPFFSNSTPLSFGGITLSGTGTSYYDGSVVRFYQNNTFTLTPATGVSIAKVEIVRQSTTGSNTGTINCSGLTASSSNTTTNTNIYKGNATSAVTFTAAAQARFTAIKVYYYPAVTRTLKSIAVSGTPTKTTYEAGESFDPAGLTVTGTYDEGDPEVITSGITWSTPDALVAGQTSVKITATVKGITSPEYDVTGLTVKAVKETVANPTISYTNKLSDGVFYPESDVTLACATEGATIKYRVDVSNGGVALEGLERTYSAPFKVGAKTNYITAWAEKDDSKSEEVTLTLKKATEYSSLNDLVAATITAGTGVVVTLDKATIKSIFTTTQGGYRNGIFFNVQKDGKDIELFCKNVPTEWVEGGTVSGTVIATWTQFNGTWELVPTSDWTWTNLTYTAPAAPKTTPTLSFSPAKVTAYLDAQDEFKAPTLSNESGVAVEYSSLDTKVASVDASTGAVTLVAVGETTITAAFAGNDEYNEASASYTLVVKAAKPAEYAIVAEYGGKWYAATTEVKSKKLVATEVIVVDNKVYNISDKDIVWHWENNNLMTSDEIKLSVGDKTDVTLSNSGNVKWTIDDKYGFVNDISASRALLYYNSSTGKVFGNYAISANFEKGLYSGKAQLLPIGTAAELEAITSSVTVGSTGYATYCPIAYDVTIPSGVEVYYAENDAVNEDYILLTKYEGTTLKQGEGVILKNEGNYTFAKATDAATAIEGNLLVGAASDLTLKENAAYILAAKEGAAVFSLCTAGTLKGGKSYLPASAGSNAPALKLVVNDATGINNVTNRMQSIGNYNINGQMVDENYRGIVIVNGKKILKK